MSNPVLAELPTPGFSGADAAVEDRGLSLVVDLSQLAPEQMAVVEGVDSASAIARRLLDLGFIPGSRVAAVRRAPLGSPTEYEIRGTRICLRDSEAKRIRVRQIAGP